MEATPGMSLEVGPGFYATPHAETRIFHRPTIHLIFSLIIVLIIDPVKKQISTKERNPE